MPVQLQTRLNGFSAEKRSKRYELVLRKTRKNKRGRGMGANRWAATCRADPQPRAGQENPPRGAPRSPPQPRRRLQQPPPPFPPETVTDFTRLSNGITEISSQLSPDAPAVKTNPNYKRLIVPFLCHRHY